MNKLAEWKVYIDTKGIKSTDLKDNFFVLEFCGFLNSLDVGEGHRLTYAAWND